MLRSLHIRNYILIDSLDITFPEGLIIITGQTGAGKSILLGALSLLFGVKADASMLSEGASSCVVEAEFDGVDDGVRALLAEEDVEADGDSLLIRRVVSASGRSRSFVNDLPVQVNLLQRLSPRLVDIHSQHKSLLLSDKDFQLSVLDGFAGNAGDLKECRQVWGQLRQVRAQIESLRDKLSRAESEREYNESQLRQLEAAHLVGGELESLEEEHKGLANAEQIMEGLSAASEVLSPSDGETRGVTASLKEAQKQLEHIARFLPGLPEITSRLESSRLELEDVASELDGLLAKVDLSPERLLAVEERMSLIYSLLKKYSCATVEELISLRDSLSESVDGTAALEDRILELEKQERDFLGQYGEICARLSDARRKAAPGLSASITESLHFLELDRAVFEVSVEDGNQGADGADKVRFLFSSTGKGLMDISKVASGGELSRIMLCLKAKMAEFTGMPTLIFDEIDTGVSGSVADRMGQMICSMGRNMQVFSITHLPQVAAKGDAHYMVEKSISPDGRTLSSIRRIDGKERVMEIARLLSGASITPAAVANAETLLNEGH